MPHIAIATCSKYAGTGINFADDAWLQSELVNCGHEVEIVDWRSPSINWHTFDAIYVSSTWDIPKYPDEFEAWLHGCESDGQRRLINARDVLQTGIRKYDYLHHLIAAFGEGDKPDGGIIPTRFYARELPPYPVTNLSAAQVGDFGRIVAALDDDPLWRDQDIVIKPVCSADSYETHVYHRTNRPILAHPDDTLTTPEAAAAAFDRILSSDAAKGVILQVYQRQIEETEYSLVYFNDGLSHVTIKGPGFQNNVTEKRHALKIADLPLGMQAFAERLLVHMTARHGAGSITRARVDLLQGEHGPLLLELEFLEPSTNITVIAADWGEAARDDILYRYAAAIDERVQALTSNA